MGDTTKIEELLQELGELCRNNIAEFQAGDRTKILSLLKAMRGEVHHPHPTSVLKLTILATELHSMITKIYEQLEP